MQILLATTNAGKIRELTQILSGRGNGVRGLDVLPGYVPPIETGRTFEENSRLKARAVRQYLLSRPGAVADAANLLILADDSGLECEDLNGAPGVDSAYFAGPHSTDLENNRKLILELAKILQPTRRACYVCLLVCLAPDGTEKIVRGSCEGLIVDSPRGTNGFGYDPHFFLPEYGMTMAELPAETKNQISHRGRALREMFGVKMSS